MVQTTNLIATLVWLRRLKANYAHPLYMRDVGRPIANAPGLIEKHDGRAWLTGGGWELAERMIAAADDQLTLWRREQDGTLTPEDAEKRRVA
jgi:hypothetical protein